VALAFAIEVTMVFMDVASESREGYLVFLKSCIRVHNGLNPVEISMFIFPSSRMGFGLFSCVYVGSMFIFSGSRMWFGLSSCVYVGFGFSRGVPSMLIKYVAF
jgi:hypothetical protein